MAETPLVKLADTSFGTVVSPPKEEWPQVTTDPSLLTAANAPTVEYMAETPLVKLAATPDELPP